MTSSFWKNIDIAREKAGLERKRIEQDCNLANNAFTQGIKRGSSPSVDLAYKLARTVGMTMEELVDGELGVDYVRHWAREAGGIWKPPEHIADIVENLLFLDEKELIGIRASAEALAAPKKGSEGQKTEIAL